MIDATLATPYNIRPLALGVDIVIHSATKYLGGHNDLLAGVALGRHELLDEVNRLQRMIGAIPGRLTCFLLERGLKTFALRMEHHNQAGLEGGARPRSPPRRSRRSGIRGSNRIRTTPIAQAADARASAA